MTVPLPAVPDVHEWEWLPPAAVLWGLTSPCLAELRILNCTLRELPEVSNFYRQKSGEQLSSGYSGCGIMDNAKLTDMTHQAESLHLMWQLRELEKALTV